MKKREAGLLAIAFALVAGLFCLAGCEDNAAEPSEGNTGTEPGRNDETVTIVWQEEGGTYEQETVKGAEIVLRTPVPVAGKDFLGWFDGTEQLTAGTEAQKAASYRAVWLSEADYYGWFTGETDAVLFGTTGAVAGETRYGSEKMRYEGGRLYAGDAEIFTRIGETLLCGTQIRSRVTTESAPGEYRSGTQKIVLDGYGGVRAGERAGYYALCGKKIVLALDGCASNPYTGERDGKGGLNLTDGSGGTRLFVPADESAVYVSGGDRLIRYGSGGQSVAVLSSAEGERYVSVKGVFAPGGILELSGGYDGAVRLGAEATFEYASAERGTYACDGKSDAVLDGFGGVRLGDTQGTYTGPNRKGVYTLNFPFSTRYIRLTDGAYAGVEPDGLQGEYRAQLPGAAATGFILDGLGGARLRTDAGVLDADYEAGADGLAFSRCTDEAFNETMEALYGGKVFLSRDGAAYVLEGYRPEVDTSGFAGTWTGVSAGFTVNFDTVTQKITYDGEMFDAVPDVRGGKLSFIKDGALYTVTVSGSVLTVRHGGAAETFGTDGFEGLYTDMMGEVELLLDGRGGGKYKGAKIAYTLSSADGETALALSNGLTGTVSDGTVLLTDENGETLFLTAV